MKIAVCIDSSAWNWLFENSIDINAAMPPEEFSIFITREVEIEISAIPNDGKDRIDKRQLKKYIRDSIGRNNVATIAILGFAEANSPDGPAIFAGFGQSNFQSDAERRWYGREEVKRQIVGKPKRRSGLTKNIADASVAVASLHCLVLTCDHDGGPIKTAASDGRVVVLSNALDTAALNQLLCERSNPPVASARQP